MAEQTPSGFTSVSSETPDTIKRILNTKKDRSISHLSVADNASRWASLTKDKQFNPQDPPKELRRGKSETGSVGKVKTYLVDKFKQSRSKPETLPMQMGKPGHHVSTNPLKEFKYSAYDGKQVMR